MESIRRKIILNVLVVIFLLGFFLYLGYLFFVSQPFKDNLRGDFLASTREYSSSIQERYSFIENDVISLAFLVSRDFNYTRALGDENYMNGWLNHTSSFVLGILNQSYMRDNQIVSDYVVYNVEDFGKIYENWFILQNGSISQKLDDDISTFNPENPDMQWYYGPKQTGKSEWTESYIDAITGIPMISYVKPIYSSDGKFIAVVGVDLSLEKITATLGSSKILGTGTTYLLDRNNIFISNNPQNISSSLWNDFLSAKKANREGILNDNQNTLAFVNEENGQTLVSIISNSDLLKSFTYIEIGLFIGLGLLLILTFIILYLVLSRFIDLISELYFANKEIQKGNYNVRVDINTHDEMEELGNSFNETAKQLLKLDVQRKQLEKAKTEFLSITSHELRSPMTPMKAQLQMLQENFFGKLNSKQKEAVDVVLRNTDRLDRIIVDFLEISRIEAARLKFNFIKVNLTDYIKRLKSEMDAFLPEKKIDINLEISPLPTFEVDPDRVMQVLRNLINNSKKFTPDNGKINVSVQRKGDFIQFMVQDNGIGINKNVQYKLFEPFFQADNMYQHKSGGTGLGLSICKGIVESQGGRIWFNSIEGKGTTFYFTIPLIPVREIQPIRLLFSSKEDLEKQVKEVFLDFLGPLGDSEFEGLRGEGILEDKMMSYVDTLHKLGIIYHSEEFKNKIRQVFEDAGGVHGKRESSGENLSKVSEKDFSRFIKKGGKK